MKNRDFDLISVIIPVFNVKEFLAECIESVINQTYENLEIILVDDGSSDGSDAICDLYSLKYGNIVVIHQENKGVSAARNAGIRTAKGVYVVFVDSDDFIDNSMIHLLHAACVQNHTNMSFCNYNKVDCQGNIIKKIDTIKDGVKTGRECLQLLNKEHYWSYVVPFAKLIKREIFSDILFTEGIIHEDEMIIHKIYIKSEKIASISRSLYFYRENPNSITSRKQSIRHTDAMYAFYSRFFDYVSLDYTELLRGTVNLARRVEIKINSFEVNSDADALRIKEMTKQYRKMVIKLGYRAGFANIIVAIAPRTVGFFRHFFALGGRKDV